MQHMDEGRLQAWLDGPRGGLTEEERARVAEHLSDCTQCAARVEMLRESTDQVTELLALPGAADDEIPDFDSVVERARELESTDGDNRRWLAPAWAATVLLAVGLGWLANEMSRRPMVGPAVGDVMQETARARETPEPQATEPQAEIARAPSSESMQPSAAITETPAVESTEPPSEEIAIRVPESEEPEPLTVRGRVTDAETGRPLESAQVYIPTAGVGGLTDEEGTFSLSLDAVADSIRDGVTLRVELIGYESADRAVTLADEDSVQRDIELRSTALHLQELVVEGVEGDRFEERAEPTVQLRAPVEAPAAGELGEADAVSPQWRSVTAEEAGDAAGFTVHSVPELDIVSYELGRIDGEPVVRVVQALEDAGRLTLLQAARAVRFPSVERSGESVVLTRLPDGVIVVARGPLTGEALRELLARVR